MTGQILIYGANGYTGRITARLAKGAGYKPILAGRNAAMVKAIADAHSMEWRHFDLTDPDLIDSNLRDVDIVLHMAGPFSATMPPMIAACLRTRTHYIDITGEIDVIEALSSQFAEASVAGIMILPGAGFDVVPSDCLLAHLKRRLPSARSLTLALDGLSKPSRGTAKTAVEALGLGTRVRRDTRIITLDTVPRRDFDFGDGESVDCMGVSWGDVSSAYHSTAVPDIQVFFSVNPMMERAARLGPIAKWMARRPLVQRYLKGQVDKQIEGPTKEERAEGQVRLLGIAEDGEGKRVVSRLTTPEAYTLTARVALDIAVRVAGMEGLTGFYTPTRLLGPDYILEFDGVERVDLV
ncbi:MAG: saccharopine dehydrogenase family protein [Alphaproteobacteria bacterium]